MEEGKMPSDEIGDLHGQAEERIARQGAAMRPEDLSRDGASLAHEIAVPQVELHVQNEELCRAQFEREESHSKYLDLFNLAPVGYFTIDENSLILEANLTGAQLLGIPREGLVGRRFELYVNTEDRNRCYLHLQETLKDGKKHVTELRMLRHEGAEFHAQLTSMAVESDDGHRHHVRTAVTDVTEHKKAEERIRTSEEKYRSLFENAREAFILTDCKGNITGVNRLIEEYGFKREEFIGKSLFDFVVPDHRARAVADFRTLLGGRPVKGEMDVTTPRGIFSVEYHDNPIRQGGRIVGVQAILTDITRRKRMEQLLRRERDNAQQYLDVAGVILLTIDSEQRVGLINKRGCEILGYPEEEILGKNWFDRFLPDSVREETRAVFDKALRGEMDLPEYDENLVVARDGQERLIAWHNTVLRTRTGKIVGAMSSGEDITDRKRAEEAYRSLVDHSLQGLAIFQDGKVVFANQAMAEIIGYDLNEILAMPPERVHDFVHPEDREMVWQRHRQRLAGEPVPERYELRCIRKNGTVCWLEIHASRIDYRGKPAIQCAYIDVTERKETEVALRLSEENYRGIFENAVLGMYQTTPDGEILAANPALARMLGYDTFDELAERNLEQEGFQPGYPRSIFKERIEAEGRVVGLESAWTRRDGSTLWVRENARVVRDETGKTLLYEGTIEDITESKHADQLMRTLGTTAMELVELPAGADLFRFIGEKVLALIGGGIVSVNSIDGDTLTVRHVVGANTVALELAQRLLGRTVIGMPLHGVHEEARSALLTGKLMRVEGGLYELFFRAVPRPACWTLEKSLGIKECHAIGLRRPGRLLGTVVILARRGTQFNAGVIEAFVNQASIAWERRKVEEAAVESEERFRTLYESVQAGVILQQADGAIVHANRTACDIFGMTAESIQGKTSADLIWQMILEDGAPVSGEDHPSMITLRTGEPIRGAVRGLFSGDPARLRWLVINTEPLRRSEDGHVEQVLITFHDITERKDAERRLRESEQKYRELFENAGTAIILLDLEKTITDANKFVERYGFRREDLIGRNYLDFVAEPYRAKAVEDFETLRRGVPLEGEFEVITPKGQVITHYMDNPIVRGGNVVGVQSILTDIAERKRAEQALRVKSNAIASSLTGVAIAEFGGNLTHVNPAFLRMWGYSHEDEVLGRPAVTFWQSEDEAQEIVGALHKTGSWTGQLVAKKKDGSLFDVQLSASTVTDEAGKPICLMASFMDITERKKAEAALRASEERYRLLANNASDMIWTMDLNFQFTYCSPSMTQTMGYTPQEILSKRPDEILTPASCELVTKILADEMDIERKGHGEPFRSRVVEVEEIHKDGTKLWVESKASFLRDSDGKAIGIVGVTRDISQRRKIEQQLLDYQNRLRGLTAELTFAEERERRRIAVGVHDQIAQRLALMRLTLQSLAASCSDANLSGVLHGVCGEIQKAIEDAHSLTFELSNPVLYEVGFESAVESWLAQQIQDRYGITCTFEADQHNLELGTDLKIALFQIVRELLTNVIKHAQAKHVEVRIRRVGDRAQVTVRDDGIGFEPSQAGRLNSRAGGYGLFSVREKLEYLGGNLKIESAPGRGTCISIAVPVQSHGELERKEASS
jgi:PAS domain S-box-containing protein